MVYLDFPNSFVWLEGNVRHRRVHHQRKQVQDKISISTQAQECCVTFLPENKEEEDASNIIPCFTMFIFKTDNLNFSCLNYKKVAPILTLIVPKLLRD